MFSPCKLGLQNIERLQALADRPSGSFRAVHVAGTNGKGSVAWKVAKVLELSGYRTGLFVSPHARFRERVLVDGEMIPEAAEQPLPPLFDLCEAEDILATFFEYVTALAMAHFRDRASTSPLRVRAGRAARYQHSSPRGERHHFHRPRAHARAGAGRG